MDFYSLIMLIFIHALFFLFSKNGFLNDKQYTSLYKKNTKQMKITCIINPVTPNVPQTGFWQKLQIK